MFLRFNTETIFEAPRLQLGTQNIHFKERPGYVLVNRSLAILAVTQDNRTRLEISITFHYDSENSLKKIIYVTKNVYFLLKETDPTNA